MDINKYETDKSWGMVGVYRNYGGNRELFGSDVTNCNTIRLCLKEGQCHRQLGYTHYIGGGLIAEIELSSNQFADLLTNMNVGDGVPCTIKWLKNEGEIPYKSQTPKLDIIHNEIEERVDEAVDSLNKGIEQITALMNNGKLSKKYGEELLKFFQNSYSTLAGKDREFYIHQAKQELDNIVTEAKSQVQDYIDNKICSIGVKAIENGFNAPEFIEKGKE